MKRTLFLIITSIVLLTACGQRSKARGVLQDNMANSYNGDDFESGLLTLSKDVFPTDDYLYQDGQYLDKDTLNSYLNLKKRKMERLIAKNLRNLNKIKSQ